MLDFLKSGAHPDVREDLQDMYFKLTIQSRSPHWKSYKRLSLQCEYSYLSSLLAVRGVSRERRARDMSLSRNSPLRNGKRQLYSQAKKGSAEGKGWQSLEFTMCHRYFGKSN